MATLPLCTLSPIRKTGMVWPRGFKKQDSVSSTVFVHINENNTVALQLIDYDLVPPTSLTAFLYHSIFHKCLVPNRRSLTAVSHR
jgi:hypothetical protein